MHWIAVGFGEPAARRRVRAVGAWYLAVHRPWARQERAAGRLRRRYRDRHRSSAPAPAHEAQGRRGRHPRRARGAPAPLPRPACTKGKHVASAPHPARAASANGSDAGRRRGAGPVRPGPHPAAGRGASPEIAGALRPPGSAPFPRVHGRHPHRVRGRQRRQSVQRSGSTIPASSRGRSTNACSRPCASGRSTPTQASGRSSRWRSTSPAALELDSKSRGHLRRHSRRSEECFGPSSRLGVLNRALRGWCQSRKALQAERHARYRRKLQAHLEDLQEELEGNAAASSGVRRAVQRSSLGRTSAHAEREVKRTGSGAMGARQLRRVLRQGGLLHPAADGGRS